MERTSRVFRLVALLGAVAALPGCSSSKHLGGEERSPDPVARHLARFDELDFEAFNKRNWDLLDQIHTEDVLVTYPDGHQTRGLTRHEQDLKAMLEWIPDLQVTSHPVKFGAGDWTAVTGVVTGTFSRPMPRPEGGPIAPTNKRFELPMATVARWRDGKIAEEQLYWDSGAMLKQLGVEK